MEQPVTKCINCGKVWTSFMCDECKYRRPKDIYADSNDKQALIRRWQQREHLARELQRAVHSNTYVTFERAMGRQQYFVGTKVADQCPECHKPLDDHKLTYHPDPNCKAKCMQEQDWYAG